MKRNYPPTDTREDFRDEAVINRRLNQLFSLDQKPKKVLHKSKGIWSHSQQHVCLTDEAKPQFFSSHYAQLGINYLNPYEALYLLESKQLIVYHNELPLSLAEAYQLLLSYSHNINNYLVFSHLNKCGFLCLKPNYESNLISSNKVKTKFDEKSIERYKIYQTDNYESLSDICTVDRSFRDVLADLRSFGPKDETDQNWLSTNPEQCMNFQFEVYKRNTFSTNKPRKDMPGNPDFLVTICEKSTSRPPTIDNLIACKLVSSGGNLFAIIDCGTTCFGQFVVLDSASLQINNNRCLD